MFGKGGEGGGEGGGGLGVRRGVVGGMMRRRRKRVRGEEGEGGRRERWGEGGWEEGEEEISWGHRFECRIVREEYRDYFAELPLVKGGREKMERELGVVM